MAFFSGLILDGIAIVVLGLCVYWGGKKGFLHSVVQLVGSVLAVTVSVLLAKWLITLLYEGVLRNGIYSYLSDTVPMDKISVEDFTDVLDGLPVIFFHFLETSFGIDLIESLNEVVQQGRPALLTFLTDEVIGPVAQFIGSVLLFLLLVIVLGFLVRHLANMFQFVNSIPVIGPVNRVLGGITGLARGFLFLMILGVFVSFFCTITNNSWDGLNETVIQNTILFRFLIQYNPLSRFLF